MENHLEKIIANPTLHARFLNTLSYLENCGARMIARAEHPTHVREEMLKHAAEEFRHALHLKRQIRKIIPHPPKDYSLDTLLGGFASLHYLKRLELLICRRFGKNPAYLLITYAIECRAQKIYPLYQEKLKKAGSKVSVKSILLEEEEHLAEIERELEAYPHKNSLKKEVRNIEETLHHQWNNCFTLSDKNSKIPL